MRPMSENRDELTGQDAQITSFAERTLRRRVVMEDLNQRFRRRFAWQAAVAALLVIGLGVLGYRSFYVNDDADEALVAAVTELRAQVRDLGGTPVAPPASDIVEDPPSVVAVPGPEGPRGIQGPPGRDGATGAACQPSNPLCIGPPGSTGTPGQVGESGATGPAGETIVGPEGPQGPAGADGAPGAPGADGRGIASVQVVEQAPNECHLIVTYTDGTTQDAGAVDCPTPPLLPGG